MKVIELKPVKISSALWDELEDRIRKAFKEILFLPLMERLDERPGRLENAKGDLQRAIGAGRVTHSGGVFRGKFSAGVSKELKALGAVWDNGVYRLTLASLPKSIQTAIRLSEDRFLKRLDKIDAVLSQNLPEKIAGKIKTADLFDTALFKVETDLNKTLKSITVPPSLTKDQRERIAAEWSDNMEKYIKGFAEEQVTELRKTVQEAIFKGNRYESLISGIQSSYGVTQRKAKFLARQETNLLMAKFKETRYQSAGVNEYRWRCVVGSANHQVRPRHKALNDASTKGKTFRFDDPPITTEPGEPERRNNPGEDYNCRCTAIAVVRM